MKPNYYSCIINKQIYSSLTPPAKSTSLHPNVFTSINIFMDFVLLYMFYLYNNNSIPKTTFIPIFICVTIIHTFLDFFDGHVARTQGKTSKIGATLDHIADGLFYIPYVLYMLYVALWLGKGTVAFIIGIFVLIYTITMLTYRFNSCAAAIEYIGLYFEIDESKIPLQYQHTEAPITDFALLILLFYVFPIYIIASK